VIVLVLDSAAPEFEYGDEDEDDHEDGIRRN
jgi:hypothetical protein